MSSSIQHVVIAGGSGTIGQALIALLPEDVERITILSRSTREHADHRVQYSQWDPAAGKVDDQMLSSADAIINLAGASVGERWTAKHKQAILQSRLDCTRLLAEAAKRHTRIRVMVNASAIGIYPDRPEMQPLDAPGDDSFISQVVQQWEAQWLSLPQEAARTVGLRIGLVLSNREGFFKKLKPVFKWGLGAALGNGQQLVSWIHEEDVARMFVFALYEDKMHGLYNAVAPEVWSNKEFSVRMARGLGRRLFPIHVPAWGLRLLMGEMSQVALRSVGVSSEKIEQAGFVFRYPELVDAVRGLQAEE